jgi:hypothetical protein
MGGAFSGGVAPGYSLDPLRGSRMDGAEDLLGAQKAGKTPSGPLGRNCSTEKSKSSSFWRAPKDFVRLGIMKNGTLLSD